MSSAQAATEQKEIDERVRKRSATRRLLNRPELGAVAGAILVWGFFAIRAGSTGFLSFDGTASYLAVASDLGIIAVAVSMLMIAGEFDLSVGSMIGATGMIVALASVQYGWPIWGAIALAIAFSLAVGFVNGLIVIRTGLPSFIVTLGGLFILRGVTIGMTRRLTGRTQIGGVDSTHGYHGAEQIFGSQATIAGGQFNVSILWWFGLAVLATWILLRTRFGNWIFGAGGAPESARNVGVPVARVKIALFMFTALSACLVAIMQVVYFTGADVLRGEQQEFEAIIAAVIGGTLLTGGYGSAIGAVFGALIFGMVEQGIVFMGADSDWFQAFVGTMLIIAVLVNRYIRQLATQES